MCNHSLTEKQRNLAPLSPTLSYTPTTKSHPRQVLPSADTHTERDDENLGPFSLRTNLFLSYLKEVASFGRFGPIPIVKDDFSRKIGAWYTDKKEGKNYLIHKDIQNGSGKGFLIYEEMRKYLTYLRRPLVIYDFAPDPIWISFYVKKILFSFLSVKVHRLAQLAAFT